MANLNTDDDRASVTPGAITDQAGGGGGPVAPNQITDQARPTEPLTPGAITDQAGTNGRNVPPGAITDGPTPE